MNVAIVSILFLSAVVCITYTLLCVLMSLSIKLLWKTKDIHYACQQNGDKYLNVINQMMSD